MYLYICRCIFYCLFFFNVPATTDIYTLSLHDALPICLGHLGIRVIRELILWDEDIVVIEKSPDNPRVSEMRGLNISRTPADRKSTRLNSSHGSISYAVFCLKKKKKKRRQDKRT